MRETRKILSVMTINVNVWILPIKTSSLCMCQWKQWMITSLKDAVWKTEIYTPKAKTTQEI